MRIATLLILTCALPIAACRPAPSATRVATASIAAQASDPLAETRALALAPPGGASPVDELLRKDQALLARLTRRADLWVILGQHWVRKARESADPGFYLNADAAARLALDIEPDHALALQVRGLVLLDQHAFQAARQLARTEVARHPEQPGAWGVLADAELELGLYDDATAAVQRMLDLKPNLPSYSRAAHLRWLMGDVDGALAIYRHAIDAGSDSRDPEPQAWVVVQAATVFWQRGDLDGALAGCERALGLQPDHPPALALRGRVELAMGHLESAASDLSRAWDRSPLIETAWLNLTAARLLHRPQDATRFEAALLHDGPRTDPRTFSLWLSVHRRDPQQALALARAERERRGGIETEDTLAWALYRSGLFREARAASDRALALGTRSARLWFHAGAIRLAQGDGSGRDWIRRALALHPTFDPDEATEARTLLSEGP
jgi:tetratricopeptide (TPR) repeat protein